MRIRLIRTFVLSVLLTAACSVQAGDDQRVHHYLHKQEQPHAVTWGYTGKVGPAFWGDLSPEYALAKSGRRQSPIDLHDALSRDLPPLKLRYRPSKIHLIYNGHTIQENEDPGSCEIVAGKRYELQQFHFHSPSEHTVDGRHFPMEMHLVHKTAAGEVAVVAVLLQMGEHNHAFDALWRLLPDADHRQRDSDQEIDVSQLLPSRHEYYSYTGSFTTPPCTEDVKWAVLKDPVTLSAGQIEQFRRVIHGNNRPVQPLNGRTVLLSTP